MQFFNARDSLTEKSTFLKVDVNYKHLRQLSSCQPAYTAWVIWQAALGTCPPHSNRPAQAWRACLRFDSWTDHRIEADISTAINTDTDLTPERWSS